LGKAPAGTGRITPKKFQPKKEGQKRTDGGTRSGTEAKGVHDNPGSKATLSHPGGDGGGKKGKKVEREVKPEGWGRRGVDGDHCKPIGVNMRHAGGGVGGAKRCTPGHAVGKAQKNALRS